MTKEELKKLAAYLQLRLTLDKVASKVKVTVK